MRLQHPVNRAHSEGLTFGQRAAEAMAARIGSWRFLIGQSFFLAAWIFLNVTAFVHHWDERPFIMLNLILSFQAAYTGPILLIAANRSSARDRDLAEHDHVLAEGQSEQLAILRELQESNNAWTEAIHKHLIEAGDAPQ